MKHTVAVPRPVYVAMTAWFVAISAGVAEALIRTTQPGGPTAGQLAIRFAIYGARGAEVAALPSGREQGQLGPRRSSSAGWGPSR